METIEARRFTVNKQQALEEEVKQNKEEEKFTPKGAIAFFFVLVLTGLAIWYAIYFLMLERI